MKPLVDSELTVAEAEESKRLAEVEVQVPDPSEEDALQAVAEATIDPEDPKGEAQ